MYNDKEPEPYPFFKLSDLASYKVFKKISSRHIIVVCGHCRACERLVRNICIVYDDPRADFTSFFYNLETDCTYKDTATYKREQKKKIKKKL